MGPKQASAYPRGRTYPPLAHCAAGVQGTEHRGQGVDKSGWGYPGTLTQNQVSRVHLISEPRQVR